MIKRTIDISEPSYVHLQHQQLCVDRENETIARVPVEDLGVLVLASPAIVITQAVVALCQQHNVAILFCDDKHLPISVTLPLWGGHSLHAKVLRTQISMTEPTRKRLWREIVQAKIGQQMVTLEWAGASGAGLSRLRASVKSGDPTNCEAQAARRYWQALMGAKFRRDREGGGANSLLNYGYTVMRAMIARAIVGTGLHPALGLHHKNQYNGLGLADDLMEPLRPWVDWEVFKMMRNGEALEIGRASKQVLLGLLSSDVQLGGRVMPLIVASHSMAAGLKAAMTEKLRLGFPERVHRK
jgi:CRISP-associated protein Cas1